MASLKKKGDLAELKVAADLVARGCELSIPFGEDSSYDLIADYEGRLHRVQVKYTQSNGQVVVVNCRSHSTVAAGPSGRGLPRSRLQPGSVSGASRIRTGDILLAKQELCQLSYGPVPRL